MTSLDIISSSLRLINVLASGESSSSAEANDALEVLNDLLDSWSAERLCLYTVQRQLQDAAGNNFNLTNGVQTYAIGPTAPVPFDIPRPTRIVGVGALTFQNPTQPLELPLEMLTLQKWSQIPVKAIPSSRPTQCFDDGAFPNRNLSVWPIPQTQLVSLALYVWQALGVFQDFTTDYTFPPGYSRAIRYSLAVDLAPEYGRPIDPAVAAIAIQAKGVLKSVNTFFVDLQSDAALVGPREGKAYNYLTDGWGTGSGR